MMRRLALPLATGTVVVLLLAAGCRGREERMPALPSMNASLGSGGAARAGGAGSPAALFRRLCARCHGSDGSGNTTMAGRAPVPNLQSGAVQDQLNAARIALAIKNGKGEMPRFDLSEQEVQALIGYVRSLRR